MFKWNILGVLRDRTRSVFPLTVVAVGVALTVVLIGFMDGIIGGMIQATANLDTGSLRMVNKAYYEEEHLFPMDRALTGQKESRKWLESHSPEEVTWSARIRWGALLDIPDESGMTLSQTPIIGTALDLFSPGSEEIHRLQLTESLMQGRLPVSPKEMLVGYQLAETLNLKLGQRATLLGQTFDGAMAADNYIIVGFVKFGLSALDKKMALIDLKDAQDSFYMEDIVTDWLGWVPSGFDIEKLEIIKKELTDSATDWIKTPPASWASDDRPLFLTVLDQRGLGAIYKKFKAVRAVIIGVFIFLMILVLWNAGILNGIHRYGELGLRLAMGESHAQISFSLVTEAFAIGVLGAVIGAVVGAGCTLYLQVKGLDMGNNLAQTGLMLNDVVRARLSWAGVWGGMIPGILSGVLGSWVASLAIYSRSTSNLFRELENE
jgi:putative ABC transport system permease protein